MSKFQNNRGNILSVEERATSARKCIMLLNDVDEDEMSEKDLKFFLTQKTRSKYVGYQPTEPQLQWLRDMIERYVA
jgi:hypothetical protein